MLVSGEEAGILFILPVMAGLDSAFTLLIAKYGYHPGPNSRRIF